VFARLEHRSNTQSRSLQGRDHLDALAEICALCLAGRWIGPAHSVAQRIPTAPVVGRRGS